MGGGSIKDIINTYPARILKKLQHASCTENNDGKQRFHRTVEKVILDIINNYVFCHNAAKRKRFRWKSKERCEKCEPWEVMKLYNPLFNVDKLHSTNTASFIVVFYELDSPPLIIKKPSSLHFPNKQGCIRHSMLPKNINAVQHSQATKHEEASSIK